MEKPVALVTGAAKRIGRAIALDLGARGWRVAVHYRSSRHDAEQVVREIEQAGGEAVAIDADLMSQDGPSALVARCVRLVGPPSCLVNNASEFEFDSLEEMTPENWTRHMDTNLRAPVFLAQSFARHLPEGVTGNVVNIIDQRVLKPSPEFFSYSLSKAALWSATRMLAQALAPRIRVNAIGPGPVLMSIHQTAGEFARECESTLLGRGSAPEEIASAVRFILDAPAMTGQMIALDGGQHLAWR